MSPESVVLQTPPVPNAIYQVYQVVGWSGCTVTSAMRPSMRIGLNLRKARLWAASRMAVRPGCRAWPVALCEIVGSTAMGMRK